ncbi:ABC transporter ATP-binding protein [candidate division WOR-3 bacterium]|nr:ABC transporter ATP-binding protein [candidate division WOR-3 bacterium]
MDKAVEIKELKKTYRTGFIPKKINALNGLSFSVEQGCIYGLLGPNGAGKTTTMKILTGILKKDSGEALVFGEVAGSMKSRSITGFLPENPVFYPHLTGEEFMELAFDLVGKGKDVKHTEELLDSVGLRESSKNSIRTYSKGMLQRLGIAQAMAGEPKLLILDEPLSGVDPVGRAEIKDMIRKQKVLGKTIIFSTHTLPDIEELADEIGIIDKGKLALQDSLLNITSKYRNVHTLVIQSKKNDLNSLGVESQFQNCGENFWKFEGSTEEAEKLMKECGSANIKTIKFGPSLSPLEQIFVDLIGSK